MSFRLRISLVFVLLVGGILALFGTYLYFHSERLREQEFYERLEERAQLALRFFHEAERLPDAERIQMERTLLLALPTEKLAIYDARDSVIFVQAAEELMPHREFVDRARGVKGLRYEHDDRQHFFLASDEDGLVAVASAVDVTGRSSLADLFRALVFGSLLMLLVAGAIAYAYAAWTLGPVRHVVRTAAGIREPSQRIPIEPSHRHDELGEIATTFNALLARLEDAFQLQHSFIAGASHELRTPLTVVRGEVHQALQSPAATGELRERLLSVDDQAVQIQDLLGQLLWLARTFADPETLPKETVRLDEVAERAMDRCRLRYPHRPISLSFDAQDEDFEPVVNGNSVLLTAALYNLLSNAAKYGGTDPIMLQLFEVADGSGVSVMDHGAGMTADQLARVRELFYRVSDVSASEGHGIGLALVDRIAKVHKGHLEILTSPGKGTTARLVLPRS